MKLSVLIRNLNEATSLEQTLVAIKKQQTDFEFEVVVIDNESDDNSVEIAERLGCNVFILKRDDFTFGYALNYGISKCSGEIILILSSHVILLNELFLKNIPRYFENAGVAALRFVNAVSPGQVAESMKEGPLQLVHPAAENFLAANWNNLVVNHCAAIRKLSWEKIPFDEKIFASEDKMWSLEILNSGYTILYNVPCFYVYTKPFNQATKIKREVIERAAREIITGESDPLFARPYFLSFMKKIASGFNRISSDLKIQARVYKGMKLCKSTYRDKIKHHQI